MSAFSLCVSIWAPAWNLRVAGAGGPSTYRTPGGASSGTSWSAPYVAGVFARLLQANNGLTVNDVWNRLVLTDRNGQSFSAVRASMPGSH